MTSPHDISSTASSPLTPTSAHSATHPSHSYSGQHASAYYNEGASRVGGMGPGGGESVNSKHAYGSDGRAPGHATVGSGGGAGARAAGTGFTTTGQRYSGPRVHLDEAFVGQGMTVCGHDYFSKKGIRSRVAN
ncbi:hypothetical protein DL93DRAFT_2075878 [Clavulina sp. PMI_390]|nr:hypothetical protein DL93DRAFT_2075878 [Clavulina sp. PMI_390]